MITVAELWARLDALAVTLPAERVPLASALGRTLREDALAPEDQPPFDRSSIDGYLVRDDQPAGLVTVTGSVAPGLPAPPLPALGQAVRILTGTALPSARAALVMQEDTASAPDGRLQLLQPPVTRLIRRQAAQARQGDILLTSGQPLAPGALALLASLGITHPLVTRRARVAHLVTGGELIAPDQPLGAGQIRDSNSTLIASLLQEAGADLVWHRRVNDDRTATAAALADALGTSADLVLISGGASVGDHDHTGALLTGLGFTLHCEKVSSRPGKPFIAASRSDQLAFGLPGNPLAHFVCFHLFVRRVLARFAGRPPAPLVAAALAPGETLRTDPRETWWPCAWSQDGTTRTVRPLPWRDSSDLTVLGVTDALLRIPAAAQAGASVEVLPCR